MTNKLEKQFFYTFGIEPKVIPAPNYHWEDYVLEYPQITDRILLELICIAMDVTDFGASDINGLKEVVLQVLIDEMKYYNPKKLKHQVRTLFEEG